MGDNLAVVGFLVYLAIAPVLGAVVGWILVRHRFARRLDDANERAAFLRAAAEDYATRLAGYQQREMRITWPDLGPGALVESERRTALAKRAR
jgi:hypothetical protein